MKTEWFDAPKRPSRSRFVLIAVALALLIGDHRSAPLSTTVASAASASSILCSGYSPAANPASRTHGYQSIAIRPTG